MFRFCPIAAFVVLFIFSIFIENSHAAVSVTPANATCIDVSPGLYTILDDIVITEQDKTDLPSQTNTTFILTLPSGFEFRPGFGSVNTPQASNNLTALAISITSTRITVTLTVSGTNKWDDITISGVQVRALSYNVSGNILRLAGVANGGNATITGNAAGGGISHGFLESEKGTSVWSIASGNWSNPAIWSTGFVPTCIDTVYIDHNVTGDITSSVRTLVIRTGGHLYSNIAVTVDSSFHITGTGIYTHNHLSDAAITIFKGTENFSSTSSIIILRWYDINIAFPTNITGNFGNVTFDQGGTWGQKGLFATSRLRGTLTVSSGMVTMDEGTGLTTSLILSDVVVNNSGALIMATGAARNLNLTTGNYTDTSISVIRSSMMLNSQGNLNWTANGNVTISHSWSGYQHSGTNAGNTTITINGNLSISGGSFDINTNVNAPLTLNVTGNTIISGTPTYVRFIDRNSGNLQFTTNNFYINGGTTTELMGGLAPTGNGTITILNDLILTGATTLARMYNNSASAGSLTINAGRDIIVTGGELRTASTNGSLSINAGRNFVVNNATGLFRGQVNTIGTGTTTINANGYFEVNSGTARISEGVGSVSMSIVENLDLNNGIFYGVFNTIALNNGTATLTCNYINFTGGIFSFYQALVNDNKNIQVNVISDVNITFTAGTNSFYFLGIASTNNARLTLNIGYNLIVSGNFPGAHFISSASAGNETVTIGGSYLASAGDVFFAGNHTSLITSHNVTTTISGNLTVSGGITRLSTGAGAASINVGGDVTVSGGTLVLKHFTGAASLNIAGSYSQTSGTFIVHGQSATTPNSSSVTVNGNFSLTGGTFNFDNFVAAALLAEHTVYINGPNFTLGGNAVIAHANNLTTNYIFGQIVFNRAGTTVYSRTSSTNEIRHVKYTINATTTVNASSSANGFQITSVASAVAANHNSLNILGTLDMGSQVLSGRQNVNYYSGLTLAAGARYRLSHTGGLYSGVSTTPSSINGYILTLNRLNYTLDPASVVEHYGSATSVVTGIPNGIATTNSHKYGILEINFTGPAGTTWVYPETTNEVYVRTSLILTAGEFNLDNDHITTNGGRVINIENGATVSRTSGFIRSETEDGSARVNWNITANGSYIIPFGYDAANYIPYHYQQTSGNSGVVSIGTYRSAADNTPYPPSVTHVRNNSGTDNGLQTVDRFWYMSVPGVATASITFSYTASEGGAIIAPRAQLWEPISLGWFPPPGLQSNPTGTTTLAPSLSTFNNWWTLSASASPLPVELLQFNAFLLNEKVQLEWSTATEINNDYFTVEKSNNGFEFEAMGFVTGSGNSSSIKNYSFTDHAPFNGINYYRIKQTDYDGMSAVSEIRKLNIHGEGTMNVYPNPVLQDGELNLVINRPGTFRLFIFDSMGRQIYTDVIISEDKSNINISCKKYSLGYYNLKIVGVDNEENSAIKLLVR